MGDAGIEKGMSIDNDDDESFPILSVSGLYFLSEEVSVFREWKGWAGGWMEGDRMQNSCNNEILSMITSFHPSR